MERLDAESLEFELVVFDLDFTLWDCGGTWCDCLSPPFMVRDQRILDRTGRWIVARLSES